MNFLRNVYAKKMGFVVNTREKVCRLTRVLHFIEKHSFLYKSLGFKGGTAINLVIFECPRLSVDIDLDFCLETSRGDMLEVRRDQLKASGYRWNAEEKIWQRSMIADNFNFKEFCSQPWVQAGICIKVYSEDGDQMYVHRG
ncbi:nucleotidyl transferase AbiEii/AbiGii toxin family protein [Aminobacterium sp. UBA4987]|nr:nucleotidyl transferase AbiEii/AbiGii toxin family protein [Aminobacterium sp. UBA4987]